jgi:hypothetical protein
MTGIGRTPSPSGAVREPATGAIAAIRSDASAASRYAIIAPFDRPVA